MNILTITCHDVYNYGASLQAYALQFFLEKNGYDYKIIDYKPEYLSRKDHLFTIGPSSKYYDLYKLLGPFGFFLALYIHRKKIKFWRRKHAFDLFRLHYLKLTERYNSPSEIMRHPPIGDVYITGSDQVWNPEMPNGKDDVFFLAFVPEDRKRISYAASFGITEIKDQQLKSHISTLLKEFDWISVRESSGVRLAKNLGIQAVHVLDPVFLLSKQEWKTLLKNSDHLRCKYLLVYFLGEKNSSIEIEAKYIAKQKKLKIVSINDGNKQLAFADININSAGPIDFLSLISNADFVISTSFHATAFSIIFERQFFVFPIMGQNNQSRMTDLLDMLNLSERFITTSKFSFSCIDYAEVTTEMLHYYKMSKENLLANI